MVGPDGPHSRTTKNGKRGVAIDFHWHEGKSNRRPTVQLDSGEAFKPTSMNARAQGTAWCTRERRGRGEERRG